MSLSYEAFTVREMAEDILTIIKMRAVDDGITVEYNQGPDAFVYPYIWGSPLHLRQILINILSNSIKYNKKGGKISCKVNVVESTAKQVIYQVVIADTGIGMSKEFLKRIFDPFSREHEEVSSTYEGTGLGMTIVNRLVEKRKAPLRLRVKREKVLPLQ